jgi:hypothetical protein
MSVDFRSNQQGIKTQQCSLTQPLNKRRKMMEQEIKI